MRLRLQQSAALVPAEAMENARPLDKTSIQTIMDRFDNIVGSLSGAGAQAEDKLKASRLKKKNPVSAGIQDGLEKKLCQVIKDVQKLSTKYTNSQTSAAANEVLAHAPVGGATQPAVTFAPGTHAGNHITTNVAPSSLDSVDEVAVMSTPDGPVLAPKPKVRQHLTTRMLLPYYKIEDVKNFMDTFSKVDEDFSGDLDIDEWFVPI
jgi:hypothetical protein